MRHGEREDRAAEKQGLDWISSAERPQDPHLSKRGIEQVHEVGKNLLKRGITRIFCSPMMRTIESADGVADEFSLGEKSIAVEYGLVEEAKSFRGKQADEPRPNWNPIWFPTAESAKICSRIDPNYKSHYMTEYIKDDKMPNTVCETHATLSMEPDKESRDTITKTRCEEVLQRFISSESIKDDDIILFVAHGAIVKWMSFALEKDIDVDQKIKGERNVSCFAGFAPVDPSNPLGSWKSLTGCWESGDESAGHDAESK